MKRKLLSLVMALCMIVTLLPVTAFAEGGETWTPDTSWYTEDETKTEYTLSTAGELAGLAQLVNGGNNFKGVTIKLDADIDLANQEWTPIGKSGANFQGTFDGQDHTISDLIVNQPTESDVGLFGYTTGGEVKNFTLHNAKVTGYLDVGAVAGTPYTSKYSNIDVTGLIQVEGFSYVGGALGKNAYANITNVDVTGGEGSYVKAYSIDSAGVWRTYLGGLVGFMGEGNIIVSDCDVKIDVTGSTCDIGGILGILHYGNTLTNCTYEGSLTLTKPGEAEDTQFGALVGVIQNGGSATTTTTITDCTATVVQAMKGDQNVTNTITAHGDFYNPVTGNNNIGNVSVGATVNEKPVTVDNNVAKIGDEGFKTLAAAMEVAKAATGTDPVTVTITKSGTYEPFTIDSNSHNGIVVQAAEGVDAVFEISASKKMTLNDGYTTKTPGISFKNLTFVSLDGTTPLKSHYFGAEGHAFVVENCKFINKGEAAGTIAVYVDFPNVTIHNCEFSNWDAAFYTAGEGYAINQMNVTGNTYHDVNAIVNGYWRQEPADGGCLTISGNTINPGEWGTSSIVLWDWAQYQAWLNDTTTSVTSAINAVVKNNTVNDGELEYHKIHCDWYTTSGINLPADAKVVNHYLVQIDGTDVSDVAVYDADGELVANMSTASGKNYIYQLPEGEYTFQITQSQEDGDGIVTEQPVTVADPGENKTQSVTVPALTPTAVATVNGQEYRSLAQAIKDAQTGGIVELLADVSIDSWNQIWNLSGVTIDGKGHTVSIGAIESLENHDAVIHSAGGNTFKNLTIDLSGIAADSQAQGYRAFNASNGDSFTNVTVIGNQHVAYGIFAGGTDAAADTITITDCIFQDCAYAIGSEPTEGTTTSVLENLTVTGSTFTGCDYAGILYTPNVTFTGNTVSGGKLNIMHETQNVSENTFEDGSRIKFYADPENFEKNKISADSCLDADAGVTDIDVSENYWGGGAPSEEQLNGVKVTGNDVYYVRDTMNPEDLNTYIPPASTSYVITVEDSDNGTVTASRTRANKGLTVTLTVKANEGYKLDTITVTDKNGNEVKLTDKGSGKYTFTMPASAVTVEASFTKDDTPVDTGLPFTDVKADNWFYEAVKYAYDNKLMDGTSSTTFAPLMTTNRAMVVTILWRLEGQPETDATLSFTDVESGVWYTNAVNWAASKGIVKGYSDTVFAPNDTVTREQLATILYRYAESKGYDVSARGDLTTFTDGADTSSWAAEAMEWAVGSKLLSGKGGNVLDPTGTATRAEVATILMRFVESVSK